MDKKRYTIISTEVFWIPLGRLAIATIIILSNVYIYIYI